VTTTELWFPIGAAALYLYDSALLLWQNELVYQRLRKGWLVSGGTELRLAGRRVYLPNPLLPWRLQFLVRWSHARSVADAGSVARNEGGANPDGTAPDGTAPDVPQALLRTLRATGAINAFQLALICALPLCLWLLKSPLLALLAFALFYVATAMALIVAWLNRSALQLTTKDFWMQALDALACAPFAVNLTRKLAMRHGLRADPLRFAMLHFDDAALARTRDLVEARIREEYAHPDQMDHADQLLAAMLPRLRRG
jgi:hypothetical protein